MNLDLKQRLKEKFKPLGILAYADLGHICTYEKENDFKLRENGIVFFRLCLDSLNYSSNIKTIYVFYSNCEYLNEHLEDELKLISEWISIVGAQIEEIIVPTSEKVSCAIKISFSEPLKLE